MAARRSFEAMDLVAGDNGNYRGCWTRSTIGFFDLRIIRRLLTLAQSTFRRAALRQKNVVAAAARRDRAIHGNTATRDPVPVSTISSLVPRRRWWLVVLLMRIGQSTAAPAANADASTSPTTIDTAINVPCLFISFKYFL